MTTNPMRAAVATALALTFGAAAADPEPRECSLATLVGRYVFTANGFSAATGTWQPKAIVEIIQFNGDGTLSVPAVTVANALGNGLISNPPWSPGPLGSYTLDGTCTGTLAFVNGPSFAIAGERSRNRSYALISISEPVGHAETQA